MRINHVPAVSKVNETGCCPKFNPVGWDGETFVFKVKRFVRFTNHDFFYMPIDLSKKIVATMKAVEEAGATEKVEHLMMSRSLSPFATEHFLAVTKEVPGLENIKISGTFLARVFNGPYQDTPKWIEIMKDYVAAKGKEAKEIYMNYTMCPSCSKHYGVNYVVALAKIADINPT